MHGVYNVGQIVKDESECAQPVSFQLDRRQGIKPASKFMRRRFSIKFFLLFSSI